MAGAQLLALLKSDAEPAQKDQACRRLAVVGTKEAIPALVAMLSDEKMCDVARFGLQAIPDPAVDEALLNQAAKVTVRAGMACAADLRAVTRPVY